MMCLMIYIAIANAILQLCSTVLAMRMSWHFGRRPAWAVVGITLSAIFLHSLLTFHSHMVAYEISQWSLPMSAVIAIVIFIVNGMYSVTQRTQEDLNLEKRQLAMLVERRVLDLENEVSERKRAEDALLRDHERFNSIISTQYEIATAERDLNAVMDLICERTQTLARASGAMITLTEGDETFARSASGKAGPFKGTRAKNPTGLIKLCLETGQTVRCDDVERDQRVDLDSARRMGARSSITVPLHFDRKTIGLLQVVSPEPYAFGAMDVQTLQMMAGLIGAAMSHSADFEAKQALLSEAIERADRDPLTGLLNHRAFHRRLEEEAEKCLVGNGSPFAVAVMDMNNFKFFNDAYGHTVGDEVLRQVAGALSENSRTTDTLSRYGGDEFAMILPGFGMDEAGVFAGRLTEQLSRVGYKPPGYDTVIPLSLSIGVALFPNESQSRIDVLEIADARLRRAKTGAGEQADYVRRHFTQSMAGFSMLDALVTAVDTKDRYTLCHSEDVMVYSLEIARELGLSDEEQHHVQLAALLHDVGKIGVPDSILRKPGKLTDDEFAAVKQHPEMGAIIVAAVPGFDSILDAVRHHHERWDGGGYPFGLEGTSTPLMARLMAVADAYSAMTTDRPYRTGWSSEKALGILRDGSGSQWDPDCVAAFLKVRFNESDPSLQIAA